ncbi:DUF6286 domain-containing protein [Kribbella sp. NPDC051770]|uniref:Asp23/Gls24 family envelope stress response protein n=1 Tax=Kribbella sp. NPDC051770 TaxID=3155413 RepID=UPI003424493B
MADTATLAPPDLADAGRRGTLEISPRAVERIAEITALKVEGVVRRPATFGRGLPKARADLAGQRVRVTVELAIEWGHPLDEVAAEVRRVLTHAVPELTGLAVAGVHVDISALAAPEPVRGAPDEPSTASVGSTLADEPTGGPAPATSAVAASVPTTGHVAASVPAKKPVAAPAAAVVGVLAALAVIAAGAIGIRETLVSTGLIGGAPWLEWLLTKAEVLKPVSWMTPAGIAAVLLGLLILIAALKPRKATHLAVGDQGVWIRARDAARLAAATATQVDSVTAAAVRARGRRLRVTATTLDNDPRVRDELTTAIDQRLDTITPGFRIHTRVTAEEN